VSIERLESARQNTAESILAKFGKALEAASQKAAAATRDPRSRKLAAARMALEYAVLATAREKRVATQLVSSALRTTGPVQQAHMVKEGAIAMACAFQVEPAVLVNVFVGGMTHLAMPQGSGSTPEIEMMVDACRALVAGIYRDAYVARDKSVGGSYGQESFIAPSGKGAQPSAKGHLAARLAFMGAAIDAAVRRGSIAGPDAAMLKEQIESRVFEPRLPGGAQFSPEFKTFLDHRGVGLRIEAMSEVRGVMRSHAVQEIVSKLSAADSVPTRSEHRVQPDKER
jgi:hypothetical protein